MTHRDFRADMAFDSRETWLAKTGRLPAWSPAWQALTPAEWGRPPGSPPEPRERSRKETGQDNREHTPRQGEGRQRPADERIRT